MRCISMKLRLPASRMPFCATVRWKYRSRRADVERTTWGISVNKPNAGKQQGQLLEKARNEMGELAYMVPVKELTGTVTFRHLLRFSQKGQFVLPPARYVRSYAPAQQSVAAGSEWTGMQVK